MPEENNSIPIEHRVTRLETEMQQMKSTLTKIDDRTSKQEREQIRTQTMVEGIQRDMTNINVNMAKLADAQQNSHTAMLQAISSINVNQATQQTQATKKWEKFWQMVAVGVLSAIVTIGGSILIAKYIHF